MAYLQGSQRENDPLSITANKLCSESICWLREKMKNIFSPSELFAAECFYTYKLSKEAVFTTAFKDKFTPLRCIYRVQIPQDCFEGLSPSLRPRPVLKLGEVVF